MSLFRKFIKLSTNRKMLFFEALFFLWLSKVLLLLLPFKKSIKLFRPIKETTNQPNTEVLREIRDAVSRANKIAIWKNICLVKSFAARFMLQRRSINSVMYLGLQIEKETTPKLQAHAWLIADDIIITPKLLNFKEIYSF